MNAPHPITISRTGKDAWRAWLTITLRSQRSLQVIASLRLVLANTDLMPYHGSQWRWREGAVFAPRPPPLIDRPNDPVNYVPVAAQFCGLRSERLPQKSNNYVLAKNGLRPGGGGGVGNSIKEENK
jgi:hypothetical protein